MEFVRNQVPTILVTAFLVLSASICTFSQVKHGDLSLLKGKTKVLILPLPENDTTEIVKAVKQYPGLTIVEEKDDADFIITLATQKLIGSNLPPNGPAINGGKTGTSSDRAADKSSVTTRISVMLVFFKDSAGAAVQVWSKEMTDLIPTQSIAPVYNDPVSKTRQKQEPSSASSSTPKSLIKSFLADLKKKTR